MSRNRLEAFSDGVLAIVITIMVLELKAPHGASWHALAPLLPAALSYLLSFVYLAIYWNNHHHMLHTVQRIDGAILWANIHLLFWLSLVPFTTAFMGENHFETVPTFLYGVNLLLAAVAYFILQCAIIRLQGAGGELAQAVGRDLKGKASPLIYVAALPLAFWQPWASMALYAAVALMWLVPDRRIEERIRAKEA